MPGRPWVNRSGQAAPWIRPSWREALAAAGELDGVDPSLPVESGQSAVFGPTVMSYELIPRRDERYQDLDNQGVNAEAFLYRSRLRRPLEDAR